ncbi:MAG: PQQ-binding-like beta-propeller repeat protein, partial [Streptosporangiaceae bacterium]|nr:PQQ-binding-like beta-propeller repeat protein [Streptosporangiaceae bacterium]
MRATGNRARAAASFLAFLLTSCSATSAAQQSGPPPSTRTLGPGASASPYPAAAWPEYGGNAARTGVAAGVPAAGRLRIAWRARLDGAVYGQPLLIGGLAVVATEGDSLYALDRASGKVVWRRHVGTPVPRSALPCGDINPLGITGTPAYDRANGLVYAVGETSGYHHVLFGVSVTSGAVRVQRDIPAPDGQPRYDQQRPALAIAGGRAYVAFGGLAGDCGPYRGSVAGVPLTGSG